MKPKYLLPVAIFFISTIGYTACFKNRVPDANINTIERGNPYLEELLISYDFSQCTREELESAHQFLLGFAKLSQDNYLKSSRSAKWDASINLNVTKQALALVQIQLLAQQGR